MLSTVEAHLSVITSPAVAEKADRDAASQRPQMWSISLPFFHSMPRLRVFPLEVRGETYHEETSHRAVLQPVKISHDRSLRHFWHNTTDCQTDGQTDGYLLQLVQCSS